MEDRLDLVEAEVERLRNKYEPNWEALSEKDMDPEPEKYSWYNPTGWWARTDPTLQPPIDVVKAEKKTVPATAAPTNPPKAGDEAAKASSDQQKLSKEELVNKQALNVPIERIDSVSAVNKSR